MASQGINAHNVQSITHSAAHAFFDVATAPTLNVSGELTATPLVERGDDGQLRIAIRGEDGTIDPEDVFLVREVVQLHAHPVAMVATDHQVFIVPSSSIPQQNAAPVAANTPSERINVKDDLECADDLLLCIMEHKQAEAVEAAHPALWTARFDLCQDNDPNVQRLGYALGLTAVLETPGALRSAVEVLRARLSSGLPITW
jgi:hypothetical protein